jgi:hypothetical protein
MRGVNKRDFLFPLHLVSLSAVAAATVGVFFGIGFLLLAPPQPAAPVEDPVPASQALAVLEVQPPEKDDAVWESLSAAALNEVAASPTPSAPSEQKLTALGPAEIGTALIAPTGTIHAEPTGITHVKKVRVIRYHHQVTARHWAALWRPDASAGPLPGGGFYGPPNVNIGYINPR